jgi:hypothetical protein
MVRSLTACLLTTVLFATYCQRASAADPAPESHLVGGKLAEGEKALRERLEKNPRDDKVRFTSGGAQFLRGLERLGQSLDAYGLREQNVSKVPEKFDLLSAQTQTGAGVLALPICLSMRPEQEDRHADVVLDPAGRRTIQQITDNSMSVRSHGEQVATPSLDPSHDFFHRFTVGKLTSCRDAHCFELRAHVVEVGPTFFDLFAPGIGPAPLSGNAGRYVEQYHAAMHDLREPLHMLDDASIRRRVVQGQENGVVHGSLSAARSLEL